MYPETISMSSWVIFLLLFNVVLCAVFPQQTILGSGDQGAGTLRRFSVSSIEERQAILSVVQELDLDVWQHTRSHFDIYFPSDVSTLPISLEGLNFTSSYIPHSSYRPLSRLSSREDWNLTSLTNTTFHTTYHSLQDINDFLHDLAGNFPQVAHLAHIGHSGEGTEMLGLTLSRPAPSNASVTRHRSKVDKPGFVILGAQHAREWIATATALYVAHALVSNASEAGSLGSLLDTFDFHIIPAPNPDGYAYTWEVDRFWYKNRQIMGPYAKCIGLDMNRNWGYKWKPHAIDEKELGHFDHQVKKDKKKKKPQPKTPIDPCSHWFPGHRAFESPEVNNIANYITTLPHLVAFIDLRSYGQMLSAPYSYSCKKAPKDAEDQIEAAMGAAQALRSAHGTAFVIGRLCEMLYHAPGNVIDYMYSTAGIKYTYAAHLRDTGTYGFALPPEWIRPVGEETANMVEYIARYISLSDHLS